MSQDNIIFESIKVVNSIIPRLTFMEDDLKKSSLIIAPNTLSMINTYRDDLNKLLSMLVQGAAQMHMLQAQQLEDVRSELNSNVAEVKDQVELGLADVEYNIVETLSKKLDALKANEDYKSKLQKICSTKSKILATTIIDMARAQSINLNATTCKVETVAKIISFLPAALEEFM